MIAFAAKLPRRGLNILRPLLVALLPLFLLGTPPLSARAANVLAQTTATVDLPLNQAAPTEDIVLRGDAVEQSLSFSIYPHWKLLAGSELRLALRYSPLLLADRSSLSVSLGDTPFGAVRLDPAGAGGITVTLPLPDTQPADGMLTLRFDATLYTNDQACPDPSDPAAYVVLGAASTLHLAYSASARDLTLEDAPNLLLTGAGLAGGRVVFVLPSDPQYADWQAASIVAGRLGQLAGHSNLKIDVLAADQQPDATLGDAGIVYVGGAALLGRLGGSGLPVTAAAPGTAATFALNDQPVDDKEGILAVAALPWSANGIALLVTGGSDDALTAAAQALLDDSRMALLQSDTARIAAGSALPARPAQTPLAQNPNATFAQLGLQDQTIYGGGSRVISETLFVPASWQISGDGALSLDYGFSGLLDAGQSTAAVLLNGQPVSSFQLPGGTQRTTVQVTLPQADWQTGDNTLAFRFSLRAGGTPTACATSSDRNIWATVYSSSKLNLPYGVDLTRRVDLGLYPFPFSGTGPDQDSARVVLPYNPTSDEQSAGLTIVAGLGQQAQSGALPLLLPADRAEAAKYNYDLILLGGPERNPISQEMTATLPVQWSGNMTQTLTTQWGVVFPALDQGDVAVVQEVRSPWQSNRLVLDAGYTRPGLASRVADAIGQSLYIGKFKGNVLVIGLDGTVTPLDTTTPPAPTPAPTAAPSPTAIAAMTVPTPTSGGSALLPLTILLATLLLLGLIVLILRRAPTAGAGQET